MRAEIEIKNLGLIVQIFLREWCVIARRPNFCVNWFAGVFLMSTQFLAIKSQRYFSLYSAISGTLWRIHFWTHFSCSLNLIFGNVTNDKLRYKVAVNQYGWERISRYCQTSSTWDLCWRNGRGGDWFIPSSKWPSIQSSCFSTWLLLFYCNATDFKS